MLELNNICFKRDNKKILDHINLKIDTNRFIAITGPNGSGKSTLAKIIMGIEKPDEGDVIFDGKNITDMSIDQRAKIGIGFAFQQPVKFKGITVYDLLKIASQKNLNKKEACEVLSKVGLCANEYIGREINSSLSGGELKRIEIATVAIRNCKFTIFDEPEAGIDLWSFTNLIDVFENIRNIVNGTTIVISHQERILEIADKVILLRRGKIDQIGDSKTILNNNLKIKRCCKLKE